LIESKSQECPEHLKNKIRNKIERMEKKGMIKVFRHSYGIEKEHSDHIVENKSRSLKLGDFRRDISIVKHKSYVHAGYKTIERKNKDGKTLIIRLPLSDYDPGKND
jgi:hypothetical protein